MNLIVIFIHKVRKIMKPVNKIIVKKFDSLNNNSFKLIQIIL